MKGKIAARANKSAAKAPATGASGRKSTKRDETSREFAQTSPAHIQPTVQDGNSGNRDVDSAITRTLMTATRSATGFNLQLLEMARSNANSAFDFAHQLMGMQSPSEFMAVSVAHARKQFESFNEQARQLATLAQEGRSDPATPRAAGTASSFARASRTDPG
jgi:hypothetical protein